jgi:Copper type II ascorbate-dependent monooxygenase, C-terminal domain
VSSRRLLVVVASAMAVFGAVTAFASRISASSAPARPTYYQNVKPILDSRCAGCHFSGGVAPFPLQTYAQARRHRAAIAHAVGMRHMPPWFADSRVRAYKHDPTLSAAQIRTTRRWAATGAARGNPARPGRPLPSVTPPAIRPDVRLPMPEAYTPSVRHGRDDYRCFVLPWSRPASTFMTGFNVRPGFAKEVHHMIVFLARPGDAAMIEGWERADQTPGYSCYGGPSLTGGEQIAANFLAGWVPGSGGGVLPEGTGVEIVPGSRLILQVHYNLDHVRPAPDRSVVELQLADAVAKRGSYVPLVDFRWLVSQQTFRIPAGRKRIVHSVSLDPRFFLPVLGARIDVTSGFTIHSVLHHMHLLGTRGEVALVRANGRRVRLLSIRDWHFHWQREYQLARAELFEPGDQLSLRCEHDNTAANQPVVNGRRQRPRTIYWGENSTDEMCIAFLYVTER